MAWRAPEPMKDNQQEPIFIGKITAFGPERDAFGAPTTARVVPITAPDSPTRFFVIAYWCRDPRCDLQQDTEVWCARAEDGRGIILARADGEYTRHFPGDMHIDKGELPNGDVHVEESINVQRDANVQGTVTGSTEVIAAGIHMSPHTHTGAHGETSGPHG